MGETVELRGADGERGKGFREARRPGGGRGDSGLIWWRPEIRSAANCPESEMWVQFRVMICFESEKTLSRIGFTNPRDPLTPVVVVDPLTPVLVVVVATVLHKY